MAEFREVNIKGIDNSGEEEERKKIAAEHERAHAIRLNAEAQREEAKRDKEFQEFNDKRIRQNIKDYDEVLWNNSHIRRLV